MEQRRLYPVGEQSFERIRLEHQVYVDKTAYVYNLANSGSKTVFLSRPRRFGKSLLCDTLTHYFRGRKELFEGLAIAELEKDWTVYPVMRFDMSKCKNDDVESVRISLGTLLREYEVVYGRCPDSDILGDRLRYIIEQAHRQTGQQVVLIFDEYDSPVLNVVDDKEKRDAIRSIFNTFYGPVKSMYEHLRFTFITGITKFSQMSIFSTINNIKNISLLPEYEGICGITTEELTTVFAPDIEMLAAREGVSVPELQGMLRERYDGYRFGSGLTEVYNPFSLILAFDSKMIDDYWFGSATPSSLIKILQLYPFSIDSLERSEVLQSDFDVPFDNFNSVLPILVQSGYMTIKGYDHRTKLYTLDIPNGEVREGLRKTMMNYLIVDNPRANNGILIAMMKAMMADDIEAALRALQNYLLALPYDLSNKSEKDYETILKVLFDGIGVLTDCEVKNATGRCDVVLKSEKTIYVLELKLDGNGTADDALAQIDEKHYLIPYWSDPRPKVKVGVLVDPMKRTITDWKIECP